MERLIASSSAYLADLDRRVLRRGVWLGLAGALCILVVAATIAGVAARTPAATGQAPNPLPSISPVPIGPPLQIPGLPPIQLALPSLVSPSLSPPAPSGLDAYRGLGSWVDLLDYAQPGLPAPKATVDELARRGVRTLYVQTARWSSGPDIDFPAEVGTFLDAAHSRGMKVVGWYLAGFADIGLDIRRSLAVLQFTSPSGGRFDGFAADIEDRKQVGWSQARFNDGIAAFAAQLRSAVPAGTILGAIVPDARNNDRAPGYWAGFPWPAIGANFDVVLPMAYWSVTKNPRRCLSQQMDAAGYLRQVIDETTSLMGRSRPMAPAGGVATCDTVQEVNEYVGTLLERGATGGGLYDFRALDARSDRDALWASLARLNG